MNYLVVCDGSTLGSFASYDVASDYMWSCVTSGCDPEELDIVAVGRYDWLVEYCLAIVLLVVLVCGIVAIAS